MNPFLYLNLQLQLLESVIKSLLPESHTLVLLNGLIHTDDNLALKSIIQQLQIENLDGAFAEGSYAGLYFLNMFSMLAISESPEHEHA